MAKPIRTDEAARRYLAEAGVLQNLQLSGDFVVEVRVCGRCGGAGGWAGWPGYTCYACGGINSRRVTRVPIKRYAQRIKARRSSSDRREQKRQEKERRLKTEFEGYCAAHPELAAAFELRDEHPILRDLRLKALWYGPLSDLQVALALDIASQLREPKPEPTSRHLGTVGERRDFELAVVFATDWESQYGTTFLYVMADDAGNKVVYKGSTTLRQYDEQSGVSAFAEKDDRVVLKATVKEHSEHVGEKQTIISRPKVQKVVQLSAAIESLAALHAEAV